MTTGSVSRWTDRFAVGSALSMVALQVAFLFGVSYRAIAVIGLFGAVLPMVFGMAYLLLPSYVGRTLATRRLPGVHFVVAYAGAGLLAGHALGGLGHRALLVGALLWSGGIALFVGALLRTVLPALARTDTAVSQRSTRLAVLVLPVALGYLVGGTVALLSMAGAIPFDATLPMVVHCYATGFVALLIFGLGMRLMAGFFHVTPPKRLSWVALVCGSVAPGVLSTQFWRPPWFVIGASLEFVAVAAYAVLVAVVSYRTESRRVGRYGIGLGALGGVVAVGGALGSVLGVAHADIGTHVVVVLDGFLLLTIVGYAYQFFPVTNGQFWGATDRTAVATILCLGAGTGVQALAGASEWLHIGGVALAVAGTGGYAYLLSRRVW